MQCTYWTYINLVNLILILLNINRCIPNSIRHLIDRLSIHSKLYKSDYSQHQMDIRWLDNIFLCKTKNVHDFFKALRLKIDATNFEVSPVY